MSEGIDITRDSPERQVLTLAQATADEITALCLSIERRRLILPGWGLRKIGGAA